MSATLLAPSPVAPTNPYDDIAKERTKLAPLIGIAEEMRQTGSTEAEILTALEGVNLGTSKPVPPSVLAWIAGHVIRQAAFEDEQQQRLWRETLGLREMLVSAKATRPDAPDRPGPNGMTTRIIDLAALLSNRGWSPGRIVKAALALNAAPQRGEWSLSRAGVRRLAKAGAVL